MSALRELGLHIHYEGSSGEILTELVVPALETAVSYDRLTGYFSVASLLAISEGIDQLWRRSGKMRLVIGIHDVPEELEEAASDDEWVERLVVEVRDRLLAEVATLSDELARERIGTLAWMMRDGLLTVRVAAPRTLRSLATAKTIFHSKRLIFEDESGDVVSAVGSPNETAAGLAGNFEELTVHMSWSDPLGYVSTHVESFERIWSGARPELVIRHLDQAFASELARAAGVRDPKGVPDDSTYQRLLAACRSLRSLAHLNLSRAALFPHQERALLEAADRWPIRVLLADEVGLGKTLEGGALVAHLRRTGAAKRIVILAPRSVLRQWRDEMSSHFNLDFWLYESAGRYFESPTGAVRRLPPGANPVGSAAPDLLIVSAQLARGRGKDNGVFATSDVLPDMLVVDEAHAARVRREADGSRRPTRLWRMIDSLADRVPHLVFLTATPLQLDWGEYYSLLELLGLPDAWTGAQYERSLEILAQPRVPSLQDVSAAVVLLESSRAEYGLDSTVAIPGQSSDPAVVRANTVSKQWPSFYPEFVRHHPASVLTIRHSRDALAKLGYRFPERVFQAPPLEPPSPVRDFYEHVLLYLREAYGRADLAAAGGRGLNLGFAKSTYLQRLASTLEAARGTLERRLTHLEQLRDGIGGETEPDDESGLDADDDQVMQGYDPPDLETTARVVAEVAVERMYVLDLLKQLEFITRQAVPDPKLTALMRVLDERLQVDRVLVFSRYTDSVAACVAAFRSAYGGQLPGHGVYTGKEVWIDSGSGALPVSKEGIRAALTAGDIRVLFCSDAASEGLNLQAARVIVNVDVPWNPARLEQRIGRVARMGQQAPEVEIINLWYPDSVEARMYGRLLSRHQDYRLAVGAAPQLVADAIRSEVSGILGLSDGFLDPVAELQRVRESIQLQAIARVWARDVNRSPRSQQSRERLADVVRSVTKHHRDPTGQYTDIVSPEGSRHRFSTEPGLADSLTLLHPALDDLRPLPPSGGHECSLGLVVDDNGNPLAICCVDERGYLPVAADDMPVLLSATLGVSPFDPAVHNRWVDEAGLFESVTRSLASAEPALPGAGSWTMVRPLDELTRWARPAFPRPTRVEPLGRVRVDARLVGDAG